MTNEAIRSAIATRIEASWSTCSIVSRPNTQFEPPTGNKAWMKYHIKGGDVFPGEIPGPNVHGVSLRMGIIMIEINVPINSGTKVANAYADRAEHFLRCRNISGVFTGEPYSNEIGESAGYYRIMTTVPFNAWVGE